MTDTRTLRSIVAEQVITLNTQASLAATRAADFEQQAVNATHDGDKMSIGLKAIEQKAMAATIRPIADSLTKALTETMSDQPEPPRIGPELVLTWLVATGMGVLGVLGFVRAVIWLWP